MCQLPLVSVAIITYNQEAFLRECIESVLAQDYTNIEIVVGDDASTDGTRSLLEMYSNKHKNVFKLLLHEKNQGISANSQSVHEACVGKYIAWMGGDDLMLPGKLQKQVCIMESDPGCNLVYHDLDVFRSETGAHLYYLKNVDKPREGGVDQLIKHGTFNGACSTMVRREATPSLGFDPRLNVASDWLYWIETVGTDGSVRFIDEVLGRYRRHSGNITNYPKNHVGVGMLDELISCQIIIAKYPQYSLSVLYRYARVLFSLRKALGVFTALFAVVFGCEALVLEFFQKPFKKQSLPLRD